MAPDSLQFLTSQVSDRGEDPQVDGPSLLFVDTVWVVHGP